jgi:hypothetical protein
MDLSKQQEQRNKIAPMKFSSVYPHYINKVEKKGRTKEELDEIICWLCGFKQKDLEKAIDEKMTFEELFEKANLPSNAKEIKGVICGVRVEEIEEPLVWKARCLDKIVDELAKGKAIEKIKRQ